MKLTSTLLLILSLALAIIVVMHVASVAGSEIRTRHPADLEEAATSAHKNRLTAAIHELSALNNERAREVNEKRAEIRANQGVSSATQLHLNDTKSSADEAVAHTTAVDAAKTEVQGIPARFADLSKTLTDAMATRAARANAVRAQVGDALDRLVDRRKSAALMHEDHLRLEFNLGRLATDLRNRNELLAKYRFIRPEIQAEVGDNGPHVQGSVLSVSGNSIVLDRGSRHGVELYQKFSILKNGTVVATANVVEVRNGTAEAQISSLPYRDRGVLPTAGDVAVPRQLHFSIDNPGLTGR